MPERFRSDDEQLTQLDDVSTVPLEDHVPIPNWPVFSAPEGNRFGRYNLIRLLGRGGFGEVWEVEDTETGRHLALKVLTMLRVVSPQIRKRFQREGQLAAAINHPRSVYVFGAEEIAGYPVIGMELMPGGTLQDRIQSQARIPVESAVDSILDIIEGLEAAQAKGIVHRDIKPSNCFIDGEGRAKIGDYGISKTLEPDDILTVAEAFVGTPSYASPEQIRGREVDFRSDIYSVGATLYSLLTGKRPFEGKNAGELLARILSEDPVPLSQAGVSAPRGLEKVIRRCMAKDREKRYRSYAALRADLLPFSSFQSLTTENLAKRFAAFAIDGTVIALGVFALAKLPALRWGAEVPLTAVLLIYYVCLEGLWGRSLGKHLMGMRVLSASGAVMTLRQQIIRMLVFGLILLPLTLTEWTMGFSPPITFATILIAVITMRRDNGFAALHDFVSTTRVMSIRRCPESQAVISRMDGTPTLNIDEGLTRFGPYVGVKDIWRTETEALVLAFDYVLRRNAWIHISNLTPANVDLFSVRPGKLRWLQGERGRVNWNAFEAPQGISFWDCVESRGRLPWVETRRLLLAIAEELETRLGNGKGSMSLSLPHLWIDALGRPKILEFPAFIGDGPPEALSVDLHNVKDFLYQVLYFALTGECASSESVGNLPPVPLPEHARTLIARMCNPQGPALSLTEIVRELRRSSDRTGEVARSARVNMLATVSLLPIILLVAYVARPLIDSLRLPRWEQELRNVPIYDTLSRSFNDYSGSDDARIRKEAVCKILAWVRGEASSVPRGRYLLLQMRTFQREMLDFCRRQYPSITEVEAMEAQKIVNGSCRCLDNWTTRLERGVSRILWAGGLLWILPVGFSFIFPPGIAGHIFGLALQTTTGRPAGPLRLTMRSFFAWLPFAAFFPLVVASGLLGYAPNAAAYWKREGLVAATLFLHGYTNILWMIDIFLGVILLIGITYSVVKPARGLPDLLAGTVLVPR